MGCLGNNSSSIASQMVTHAIKAALIDIFVWTMGLILTYDVKNAAEK